jgi:hypothetical protein
MLSNPKSRSDAELAAEIEAINEEIADIDWRIGELREEKGFLVEELQQLEQEVEDREFERSYATVQE